MFEVVSTLLQFLGVIGLVVTLVFVWRQAGEMSRQTAALTESVAIMGATTLDDAFRAVSSVFVAHPEIRSVFYPDEGPQPDLGDNACRLRANAVAEMLCDIFDGWYRLRSDSRTWATVGSWYDAYMNDALGSSGFLRDYLLTRAGWYHEELVALAVGHQNHPPAGRDRRP